MGRATQRDQPGTGDPVCLCWDLRSGRLLPDASTAEPRPARPPCTATCQVPGWQPRSGQVCPHSGNLRPGRVMARHRRWAQACPGGFARDARASCRGQHRACRSGNHSGGTAEVSCSEPQCEAPAALSWSRRHIHPGKGHFLGVTLPCPKHPARCHPPSPSLPILPCSSYRKALVFPVLSSCFPPAPSLWGKGAAIRQDF